jgi:SAM-dependent methyltransferase
MQAAAPLPAGSTFVDFGCGKGRAVLLAGEHPFRAVVGVEFSPELVEVARRNLRNCRGFAHVCCNMEVVCMDAARYEIPAGPLVLYFYNPFMEEVMQAVIERLRESLARDPRPVVVIYATPTLDHLWAGVPGLRKTMSSRGCTIYR